MERTDVVLNNIRCSAKAGVEWIVWRPGGGGAGEEAETVAASVNTVQLYFGLRKRYPELQFLRSKRKVVKILGATAVGISRMSYVGLMAIEALPGLIFLGLAVCVAAVIYLALLIICKIDEVKLIGDLFHRG